MSATEKGEVILYSYWRSSCSWRVRLILALKGIEYKYVAVHLVKKQQKDEEFLKLNPSAQVPVLFINGLKLSESVAIAEYLEETYRDVPLLPQSPALRAKVRHICEIVNSGIQPKQNLALLMYISENLGGDAEKQKWAKHWISVGLKALEEVLKETAGKCCVGDSVTFADCFLVPQIYNARRFGVDPADYPTVNTVYEHVANMPSFQAAHPSAQPDANS